MPLFTTAQLEALARPGSNCKIAVEIDISSPLRYTSGFDPIQISGDWYIPRGMSFNGVSLAKPEEAATHVIFDDLDGTMRSTWYSEPGRFSLVDVTVFMYLRETVKDAWEQVYSVVWQCSACSYNRQGQFKVGLRGYSGFRSHSGLEVGTRDRFEYAPEPGEVFKFTHTEGGFTIPAGNSDPPGSPGGNDPPFDPRGPVRRGGGRMIPDPPETPSPPHQGHQQQQQQNSSAS